MDLDVITHVCICGSQAWRPAWVIFEDYEIAAYSLEMECVLCGNTAIAPTELDRPYEL
jgi:hypothetical protein